MGSGSLNRRKRENRAQKKHDEYISEVRKAAVNNRRDRQEIDGQDSQEESEDEIEEDMDENENQTGTASSRTAKRLKAKFRELLPPSEQSQCELLAKLVVSGFCNQLSVVKDKKAKVATPRSSLSRYYTEIEQFLQKLKCKYSSLGPALLLD